MVQLAFLYCDFVMHGRLGALREEYVSNHHLQPPPKKRTKHKNAVEPSLLEKMKK